MRLTRLAIGALLVLGALWILVGEQMAGASADAVVNARLATLRAPIAGQVELPARALGARVGAGEELGAIADPLADQIRLDDLDMERRFAEAALARAAAQVEATESALAEIEERAARHRAARIAWLEDRLDHARARLSLLETGTADVPAAGQGAASPAPEAPPAAASAPAGPTAAERALAVEEAAERVHLLEIELDAARDGHALGEGFGDLPYLTQQADLLRARLAEQEAARAEAEARLAALADRVAAARLAVNRLSAATLTSPVDGQVWEVLADDGEHVQRGQDVLVLLDCDSLLVTLSVTESVYNTLSLGDPARFRLSGDGRDFEATVSRLAGSGAATIYRNLAVAPSQEHLERWDVTLLVPGLATAEGLDCPVGRTGRAFFGRRPLDWLRGL